MNENYSITVPIPPPFPDGVETILPEQFEYRPPDNTKDKRYHRTKWQREEDLIVIAEMRMHRKSHKDIAEHLTSIRPYRVTVSNIHFDIKEIRNRAGTGDSVGLAIARQEELERLEWQEGEIIEQWFASKGVSVSQTRKTVTLIDKETGKPVEQPVEVTVSQEKRLADPRYMALLIKIHERRCQLQGLDAPSKVEVGGKVDVRFDITVLREKYLQHTRQKMALELQNGNAVAAIPEHAETPAET